MKNFSIQDKCRQAAIAYIAIGIVYTIVGTIGMPPHDYGALIHGMMERKYPSMAVVLGSDFPYATALWAVLITLGLLFFGLSYFIYKGYRSVLYVLTVIYLFRTIFVGRAAILTWTGSMAHSEMIYFLFPMVAVVFYFLARATFDLKP